MFKTVRMQKLKIMAPDDYIPDVVKNLHEEGIVQVEDVSERIQQDPKTAELLKPSKVTPYTGKISSLLMKTTSISELLGEALTVNTGLKGKLKGFISPQLPNIYDVEEMDTETLIKHAESVLAEVEPQTKEVEDKIAALDSEKSSLESHINVANKLKGLDLDLSLLQDSNHTSSLVGRMDVESIEEYKKELSKITEQLLVEETNDEDPNYKVLITIVPAQLKDDVYILLRKFDFERLDTDGLEGTPTQVISKSNSRIQEIEVEKSQVKSGLKTIADEWDDKILVLKEQLEIEKERNEIYASFGKTKTTKVLEAYIPKPKVEKALKVLDTTTEGNYVSELEDIPDEDEDVPILQKNNSYAKPYETLVQMYGPMKYNTIDPTLFVAITYPFFFGFCLTDAGYGIFVTLLGVLLYMGLGKIRNTFKNFGIILMECGIWAIVLGLITNSFIGDLFPRFFNIALPTVVPMLDSFKHPANILIIAIAVGILYTNVAFICGAINNIRNGEVKEALGSQICWFFLEIGIIFLAAGFMIPAVGIIGKAIGAVLIIITFILLIYASGPYGVMDVFGFLGDVLSYARLLALCLATGGIAMTVNILTQLVGTSVPYVGILIAIIIFIFGQIANFCFQVLGALVNALRLNYVEFFGQFYISGKNMFEPFKAKRRFTKVKK
jgi:V/A-type H+-transporting ATPase subunit I